MNNSPALSTIHGLFLAVASEFPSNIAVEYEGESISYKELERRSAWIADNLEKAGIKKGDLVGLSMERSPDLLAAMLGILRTGAAYVPLDAAYPRDRLDAMAEDARLRVVVADEEIIHKLNLAKDHPVERGTLSKVTSISEVPCLLADALIQPGSAGRKLDADAQGEQGLRSYVIFTSGSTGRPKGVEVAHTGVVNLLRSCANQPGLNAGESLLAVTTISFDIHVLELFLPLSVGARVILLSGFDSKDPKELNKVFRKYKPDMMQATPAQWRMLLDTGFAGHKDLKILIGGEALTRPMADALLDCSAELWNCYGPTETTVWSAIGRVSRSGPIILNGLVRKTSFHILKPEIDAKDTNSISEPLVKPGEVGELWIGGSGVALGYLGRPDLTHDRFVELPVGKDGQQERIYRTGDLVRQLPSGDLEFLGRADFMVKIRGHRVELGEIETVLYESPSVRHAVVVAAPHHDGENRLIAYVELHKESNPDTITELIAKVRKKLPAYMAPSYIVALKQMPLTPNGKIDRKALPEPPNGRPMLATPYIEPANDIEAKVCKIFAEVIDVDKVGAGDDYFDLGGTSVLIPGVLKHLDETLGTPIGLRDFLQSPNPRDVAAFRKRNAPDADDAESALKDTAISINDLGSDVLGGAKNPKQTAGPKTVFLTGATGFVGAYLLYALLASKDIGQVIALVRAQSEEAAYGRLEESFAKYGQTPDDWKRRVSVVLGELSLPLLGLSPATFESVAERADVILHNGAQVNLLYPYAELRNANVQGSREVLRLATTGKWKPVYYVSTLDVFDATGKPDARHIEEVIPSPEGLQRGYELSKWAAETLLANATKEFGIPVSIVRLGMVGGHSKTGKGQADDELNRFLLTGLEMRKLPNIQAGLRCVPVDVVADILTRLVARNEGKRDKVEVLHINPATGVTMDEVRIEMSDCLGLPVDMEDAENWFAAVRNDPDTALFPLIDLFAEGDPSTGHNYLQISSLGSDSFSTERLNHILDALGVAPPAFDTKLLRVYLSALTRKGSEESTSALVTAP